VSKIGFQTPQSIPLTEREEGSRPNTSYRKPSATGADLLVEHLGNRHNSLDLLRLLAASLVILGHSYAIVGSGVDPMAAWNGVTFSGGFALYIFFFLSGLLVTYSFLNRPDPGHWFASRVLRIVPGLCVCLLLTTFVLGSLSSTLPLKRYLTDRETWDYFLGNVLFMRTRYFLPGVFTNHVDKAVNGPLWSLYLEVRLYLFAGILLWAFRGRRREWLTFALLGLAAVGLTAPKWIFVFGENGNHAICSALFLMGALCALWSDRVVISGVWLAVLFLAVNHYVRTPAFTPLFFFFSCGFVLCFGYSRWLSRIRLPGDYSYGMYIYGWPVQQFVADRFPHLSPLQNTGAALVGTAAVAAMSWHLVEKRSLAQKQRISGAIAQIAQQRFSRSVARYRAGTRRIGSAIGRRRREILVAMGCGAIALMALHYYRSHTIEALGSIIAFGPDRVDAGQRFNVQPDGLSAIWVKLPTAALGGQIVFRGKKLKSAIAGAVVTASVPDALLKDPGEVDVYVLNESYTPPRRSSIVKLRVVGSAPLER
jgi:peptidoglycan/LPS O-acetylase OafA/YrhL